MPELLLNKSHLIDREAGHCGTPAWKHLEGGYRDGSRFGGQTGHMLSLSQGERASTYTVVETH